MIDYEKLTELSTRDFVEILSTKDPFPGGGGASALVGAMGTALGNMVGALTTGKEKYKDVEIDIQELIKECNILQQDFLDLVGEDARAFAPLAKAYSLAAVTEEEISKKDKIMEDALAKAASVPLIVMEKSCRVIDICLRFSEIGSRLAISDAGVGVQFAMAALKGAALNVFINTKLMKNRKLADDINLKADKMLLEYCVKAESVYDNIMAELRKI